MNTLALQVLAKSKIRQLMPQTTRRVFHRSDGFLKTGELEIGATKQMASGRDLSNACFSQAWPKNVAAALLCSK